MVFSPQQCDGNSSFQPNVIVALVCAGFTCLVTEMFAEYPAVSSVVSMALGG